MTGTLGASSRTVALRLSTYETSRAPADARPAPRDDHEPVGSRRSRDVGFAAGSGVLVLVWTWAAGRDTPADRPLDAGGYLLVAACAGALGWRCRAPLPVLAATTVGTTAYLSIGYPYGPVLVPMAIAVYTVARHVPWRAAVPAALLALGVLLLHLFVNDAALPGALALIPASAWVAVPFAVGSTVASIDAGRRAALERGIADERLRVAQEVHDVVGHGLAAIKMQADVALHVLAKRPEQARLALETVSRTSAQALDELRSALAMVRGARVGSVGPGFGDLEGLYERMREAGLRMRVDVHGTPPPLSPAAELAAYRVVQEAMTNVLKHADRKEATVVVDHRADGTHLEISSPHVDRVSTPRSPRPAGLGLTGMRDRVLAQQGRFSAGPEPDGRFVVRAWLPRGDR
jgi:signal transduction histidine kinase